MNPLNNYNFSKTTPLQTANYNLNAAPVDSILQKLSNSNPELANKTMDLLGYTTMKTPTTTSATPPPTQMDASTLNNPSTINLKPQTQTPVPDISTLVSTTANASAVAPQVAEPKSTGLADKLAGLFTSSKGKETELAGAVSSASAPYAQQLNEIETQIKTLQAQSIKNQEDAMRKGETLGFASREQQAIARTDAIQGLFLSAQAEGMRGNIALAEQRATQAINAKYAEIDKQIEDVKTNIYNNYDSFSAAEKKAADQTLLRIDAQDAFVKERKEDDKITQGFIQEAIKQSATSGTPVPSLILQRAQQAQTPTEALQILAPYMVDAQAKALALEQLKGERLQNQKLGMEIDALKNVSTTGLVTAQGKPLTDAQSTALGYAKRLAEAGKVIDEVGNQFTGAGSLIGQIVPNIIKSEDRQKFEQAQRNFINAVLRKESGAVISDEEFANARQQYFPQPGDTAGVLSQKKQNRNTVYQNLLQSAGNPQIPSNTVTVGGSQYEVGKVYADKTGARWTVDANGKWTKQ